MTARHIASANRIRKLLAQSNDIANIEGLLTDIIHYCNIEDMNFYELLKQAEWYVEDETAKDEAELDEGLDK
jgi:hypothetical protein